MKITRAQALALALKLEAVLMEAANVGFLDEMAAGYSSPDNVNRFCDDLAAFRANLQEQNQYET